MGFPVMYGTYIGTSIIRTHRAFHFSSHALGRREFEIPWFFWVVTMAAVCLVPFYRLLLSNCNLDVQMDHQNNIRYLIHPILPFYLFVLTFNLDCPNHLSSLLVRLIQVLLYEYLHLDTSSGLGPSLVYGFSLICFLLF